MIPLPYQLPARDYLAANTRAGLFDEQGVGKTLPAVLAAMALAPPQECAVLCPAIGRSMWNTVFREETGEEPGFCESYERYTVRSDRQAELHDMAPKVLILDEVHFLGSLDSQRTPLILGRHGIARRTPYVWPLTGTPLRGGIQGLYPLLAALWPGELRKRNIFTFRAYLDRYLQWQDTKYGIKVWRERKEAMPEFQGLLDAISMRRLWKEVMPDCPPITWENLVIDPAGMTPEIRALNDFAVLGTVLEVELRNIEYNTPHMATTRRLIGEAKAPWSAQIIANELDAGIDKVFVGAYHTKVLDTLEAKLYKYGLVRIDGSTSERKREYRMKEFQTNPNCRVLLGQVVATGTTITLTAAAMAHLVEPLWVPDDNAQWAKRIHRLGQGRPCFVRMHSLAGTIDEPLGRVLLRKQQVNSAATGEAAPVITRKEASMTE